MQGLVRLQHCHATQTLISLSYLPLPPSHAAPFGAAVICSTSSTASLCAANAPFALTFSAGDTSGALGCGSNAVALKSYGE